MRWIDHRLKELGKTKAEYARSLGVSPTRVSEMSRGKRRMLASEVLRTAMFMELPPVVVLALCSEEDDLEQLKSNKYLQLSVLK